MSMAMDNWQEINNGLTDIYQYDGGRSFDAGKLLHSVGGSVPDTSRSYDDDRGVSGEIWHTFFDKSYIVFDLCNGDLIGVDLFDAQGYPEHDNG